MSKHELKPGPIKWMASHPVAGNLLMLILLLGGLLIFTQTKKEVFPTFSLDMVNVSVVYPGASPEEVEQSIVLAIEKALTDVEGLTEITAQANQGIGTVRAEIIDPDESIRILQDVKTEVDRIRTFPVEAERPQVQISSRSREVIELAVYGDVNELALRQAAEIIKDELQSHPDIGPVELTGARDLEIHIEISQENLRRYQLSLTDVANRVRQNAIEQGGGSLKTVRGEILVRMNERRDYAKEFANIPIITQANGAKVYLRDIATIRDGFEDTNNSASFNHKPAILLNVFRVGQQTPTLVVDTVNAMLPRIQKSLPSSIKIGVMNDRSKIFRQRAQLLLKNGLLGLLLVILLLALFLDLRLAFWVSMGIPVSFLGAFFSFPFSDVSINIISMFAFIITLGIVVDDAVVMGENIYRYRQLGYAPLAAAVTGARQIAIPLFTSVTTNMVAFVPLLFIPGFPGKIFKVIPSVVIAAFFVSLIESLFILPMHLTYKKSTNIRNPIFYQYVLRQKLFNRRFNRFVKNHFSEFIDWLMQHSVIVATVFLSVLLGVFGYITSGRMGIEIFPKLESDYAYASITMPNGTSINRLKQVESQLLSSAQKTVNENGNEALSTGIYSAINDNVVEARVFLTEPEERPISTSQFTEIWEKHFGNILGAELINFIADRGGPGSGPVLAVRLRHRDINVLEIASQKLAKELARYANTKNIDDGSATGKIQYDFNLKPLAYTLGLSSQMIAEQVRATYLGAEAIRQQRGPHEITVRVRWPEAERNSESKLNQLILKTPQGGEVLLKDVAKITKGRAYTAIDRTDGYRVRTVSCDIEPRADAIKLINALESDILPQLMQTYPGLTYTFTGAQDEIRDSVITLIYGLFAVIFVMYAILAVQLSSYTQPIMILVAIPFSIIGAVAGHFIMGYSLSLMSLFGIMALAGVVVNDSLMLVYFTNQNRESGLNLHDALVKAATTRFRPIILTTMTTFIGLSPMILETSRQARFLIPMAISLGFGIVFATCVTLILVPCLYKIIESIKSYLIPTAS